MNTSVTAKQKKKFKDHLGSEWLRAQIDAAKVPGKS